MSEKLDDLERRIARLERSAKRRDRLADLDDAILESRVKPEHVHMTLGDLIERRRIELQIPSETLDTERSGKETTQGTSSA